MRHPSTGSDRPTVRGGRKRGSNPRAGLAGLPVDDVLPAAPPVVTFRPSAVCLDPGPTRVQQRRVTRVTDHSKQASDLRKRWEDHRLWRPWGRPVRHGSGPAVHSLWTTLWKPHGQTVARPEAGVQPRDDDDDRSEGGPSGRPAGRSRDGVAADRRGPPAQPACLAATERPGDAAREHRDHRRAQRLHPQPARGPAAQPHRGRADRGLRSRDPDARDGQPGARGAEPQPQIDESTDGSVDFVDKRSRSAYEPPAPSTIEPPRAAPACSGERRSLGAGDPPQPQVHLRDLRHRVVQPLPARGRGGRRRGAGQGLQPAAGLRGVRPGQDPPPARDRPLRAQPLQQRQGALRLERGVHQRVHQRDPRRPAGPVQAALPRRRRPADRRHPVPRGQDADPGGVLPHVQHPPQRQQADRADLRPRAQAARGAGGPAAQPVRVGPHHRRPAARPRDPHRDPAQEGRDGPAHRTAGRARVHRRRRSRPTSASSRVR